MIQIKDGKLRISVRNLVEFLCREGDIDSRTGGVSEKNAMEAGTKAHKKIQKSMGPDYRAEVMLRREIPQQNYDVIIEGRADGIFFSEDAIPYIDEIKGTYADVRHFPKAVPVHRAQAMCYAYIYLMENELERIGVRMTYVNLEYENVRYFEEIFSKKEICVWFESLMTELTKWGDYVIQARECRDNTIRNLQFPFEYREGQYDLAGSVYKAIRQGKELFIQAPTGVGKTLSTVFPSVKAMGDGLGEKLFYLTAKTITRTAAEEAFSLLRKGGLIFKTVTITAKDKVCFLCAEHEEDDALTIDGTTYAYQNHPVCNPRSCPYAKGHLDRVNDAVYDLITHESVISRTTIEEYAAKHRVCPFEFTLDVTYWMDGIICDYNYAFDPHVHLKRFFETAKSEYLFLIDEAHNLVDRAREMYSAQINKDRVLELKRLMTDVDKKVCSALERCNKNLLSLKKLCEDKYYILHEGECATLEVNMYRLQEELSRFMEENADFEDMDTVANFFFDVMHFNEIVEVVDQNYVTYEEETDDGFVLRMYCVNPAKNLKTYLDTARSGIFFSATLLPIHYYKELLSGNKEDYAIYAKSTFDPNNRLLLIGRDVTSRYTHRNEEEYLKVRDYIHSMANGKVGNYFVFFPSYQYMFEVYDLCQRLGDDECFELVMQEKIMKEGDKESFLARFARSVEETSDKTLIAFCVMGGSFSEGIDLKKEQLIGTLIVGTGLPSLNTASQILRGFYDKQSKNGYEYAYVYPGMNKVLQAAGRVIRTEEDYGVVILLDDRFLSGQYKSLFPREWNNYKTVTRANAAQEILDFWGRL